MRPMPALRPRRAGALATGVVVAAVAFAGCSADSSEPAGAGDGPSGDSSSEAAETPPMETTSTLGKVTGKLAKDQRTGARKDVTAIIDDWLDAAYVAGTYPRSDFGDAWSVFTAKAAADAKADRDLMTNADIGSKIGAVETTKRDVIVDLLAVKGRPQAATARVELRFKTSGDVQRKVVVRGRLYLTQGPDGWQVFGYDIAKGRGA